MKSDQPLNGTQPSQHNMPARAVSNSQKPFVSRTADWDDYPNGRWTDPRSPAFGEPDLYGGARLRGTKKQILATWGTPKSLADITALFIRYLKGELDRLPWSDSPPSAETDIIKEELMDINRRGILTLSSQPAVKGVASSHPVYGWGPDNGYVYQKAYLELLISPTIIDEVMSRVEKNPDLTYHCINQDGALRTNTDDRQNVLTWGVFMSSEIKQPTIIETESFMAWKDQAFALGSDWTHCQQPGSESRALLERLIDNWYLVTIGEFCSNPRVFDSSSFCINDHIY